MDDPIKKFETIEAYLAGQLPPEKRTQFEQKLATEPELREEVAAFRDAQLIITAAGRAELRSSVDTAFAASEAPSVKPVKPQAKVRTLGRYIAAAAAVLLLVVVAFLVLENNKSMSPAELYAAHFELPPPPYVRGDSNSEVEQWQSTLGHFSEGNFTQFEPETKQLLENANFSYRNEAYLFLGLSQLQRNDAEQAISSFEKVSRSSSFGTDADWYQALSYLKIGNTQSAIPILEELAEAPNGRKAEAAEILEQLK